MRRDPLPPNFPRSFQRVHRIGSIFRHEDGRIRLDERWHFDPVGDPWPPGELAEMLLQLDQIRNLQAVPRYVAPVPTKQKRWWQR